LEDIPEIEKVDTFKKQLDTYSGLDRLDSHYKPKKSYYENFISGRNKWCYVAEKEGKLVGFIIFNVEKRELYWKIRKVGYIDLIFVYKKDRGKGISNMLLEKAYEIFTKKKLKYIKLSVQTDNKLAHKIWKKFGFRDYRVYMCKKLGS